MTMSNRNNKFPWLVEHDPTRMYLGPFDTLSLTLTARAGYWPEGIIFQHKRTQKRPIFANGQLTAYPLKKKVAHDGQN